MADLSEITKSLVERDIAKIEELTRAAIDANIPAQEILNKDVVAGMRVVGEQFGGGEIFLPELLMAGEAAKAAMKLLRPLLTKQKGVTGYTGKAAIGTVQARNEKILPAADKRTPVSSTHPAPGSARSDDRSRFQRPGSPPASGARPGNAS